VKGLLKNKKGLRGDRVTETEVEKNLYNRSEEKRVAPDGGRI